MITIEFMLRDITRLRTNPERRINYIVLQRLNLNHQILKFSGTHMDTERNPGTSTKNIAKLLHWIRKRRATWAIKKEILNN